MSGRPRRSVNIYDYPEHLNPFFEDDNHTKLRFWNSTKTKSRSNSFSFQSIKDFKQSIFSRPARKRSGTSSSLSQLSCYHTQEKNDENDPNDEFSRSNEKRKSFIYPTLRKLGRSFSIKNKRKKRDTSLDSTSQNSENEGSYSRTPIPNRQTMPAERHSSQIIRVSVTPLPRIRFHERIRNLEPEKIESKPASPTDDTNPFKDENIKVPSTPSASKPATPPRKKKRAPPPPVRQSSLTRKSLSSESSLHDQDVEDNSKDSGVNGTNHKDIEKSEYNITNTNNKNENTSLSAEENSTKVEDTSKIVGNSPIADTTTADVSTIVDTSTTADTSATVDDSAIADAFTIADTSTTVGASESVDTSTIVCNSTMKSDSRTNEVSTKTENTSTKEEDNPLRVAAISRRVEDTSTTSKNNISSESPYEQNKNLSQIEDVEHLQLNYNSEINLSSSETSISSETRLEQQQQLNAVQDSSDLFELVQKLQLEVEKLTDDTNNNIISPNFESGKKSNFYSYDDKYVETISPSKIKSEINITLDVQDDDDDVVSGVPLSPRLVRLKKDNEWIKH